MFHAMNMIPAMPPQTVGSCFPCTVNQALIASRQACLLHNYPSIHVVPRPVAQPPQPTVSEGLYVTSTERTLFLRKSVFRLVNENIYLALTDPKLLGWYLALSPEDRKIIQDEGGFHRFLKKHPALELSKHHIYVKKVIPEELKEHFPLHNSSSQYLRTNYNNTAPQKVDTRVQELSKLTWPMANFSGGYNTLKNPENVANLSLDVELERHIQGANQSTPTGPSSGHHPSSCDPLLPESGHQSSLNDDTFYSILETDNSIVLCVPKEGLDTPGECMPESEPSNFESFIRTTADRLTSPLPPVSTCDAMVGTELKMTVSAITQTEAPQTLDKPINTEVYMLDLDYLTKEFITIKTERDELLEKVKMQRTTSPFAKIVNDLKKLETDYNKMREKILSGISLQDLKPLSSDLEEASKDQTVAKIIGDIQKASHGTQQQENVENDEPIDNSSPFVKKGETVRRENPSKMKSVSRIPKERFPTQKNAENLTDLNSNEAWFDAEEDLSSDISREHTKVDETPDVRDTENDKPKCVSAGLCVSGLPTDVSENDVLMMFEPYNASEVRISKLKELSVAIVIVGSQQSAEAAVKKLNGLRIKGHTLQIEHINTGRCEDQGLSTCDPESSNSLNKNQLTSSSSSPKRKVVCVSPTAQGTFVPQHYGTMGSFDILMSELTTRHPNVERQRIIDALLELRAKYRGVLSGLPLRTIRDMTSDLLTRPACNT